MRRLYIDDFRDPAFANMDEAMPMMQE